MRIESTGHSKGNPRLFELVENAPKTGKSPTVWERTKSMIGSSAAPMGR